MFYLVNVLFCHLNVTMFIIKKRMDPKLIGLQWSKFLKQQINQLSNQSTNNEDLADNPFYNKYADKLKNAKLNSNQEINKLENDLNEEERKLKENLIELDNKLDKTNKSNKDTNQESSKKQLNKSASNKKLDDIIKLDLIKNLNKNEIKKIWYEHFKKKDATIFACLDDKHYDQIRQNAIKYPVFVFLLPIDNQLVENQLDNYQLVNYQFVLVQFVNQQQQSLKCHFTPLAFFHTHKENAPATLTLNYYNEIQKDKSIVLMEGEYDNKVFNLLEAQCLANQIQIFYSNQDKIELLNHFTNNPSTFDYMQIVREFEKSIAV